MGPNASIDIVIMTVVTIATRCDIRIPHSFGRCRHRVSRDGTAPEIEFAREGSR